MAYVDKINVQGTDYDIQDKRLPESNGVIGCQKPFTAPEIVEEMSGYSASISATDHTNLDIENIYTSAVKNGNKLTLVSYVKIKRTDTISSDCRISQIVVPSDVASKLYPTQIEGVNILDSKKVVAFKSYRNQVTLNALVEKTGVGVINFWIAYDGEINNLTQDDDYYVRFETTFLLSDNLIA